MLACPACGSPVPPEATSCPECHLAGALFGAVTEAAAGPSAGDPAYLRTIAELISTVDLDGPLAELNPDAAGAVLSRPARFPALGAAAPVRPPVEVEPLRDLPRLPPPADAAMLRRRIEEYSSTAQRLGLDFTDLDDRMDEANDAADEAAVADLARQMFVHLASALSEEYAVALGRRNELAPIVPTPDADAEFEGVRAALETGDLAGAQRRLAHVRETLGAIEEDWAAGRILLTECELLAQTARELGIDPGPALGPFEEGRRRFRNAQRPEAERLLARAAVALWALVQPRFFEEIHRVRDRLVQLRSAGGDIQPALVDLREVSVELRQRNFAGMLLAFGRVRAFADRAAPPGEPGDAPAAMRPTSASD